MKNTPVKSPDIDIDFANREQILGLIDHVVASGKDGRQKHPSGIYLQNIPIHPLTNNSALDYKLAEEFGYFKIDFLNYHLYENVKNEAHLRELVNREPDWTFLEDEDNVGLLNHIRGHYDVVQLISPKSVGDLAIVLALIRPGKAHLRSKPREVIERDIWTDDNEGKYSFKKSHATAYAVSIQVQMNLIQELA